MRILWNNRAADTKSLRLQTKIASSNNMHHETDTHSLYSQPAGPFTQPAAGSRQPPAASRQIKPASNNGSLLFYVSNLKKKPPIYFIVIQMDRYQNKHKEITIKRCIWVQSYIIYQQRFDAPGTSLKCNQIKFTTLAVTSFGVSAKIERLLRFLGAEVVLLGSLEDRAVDRKPN